METSLLVKINGQEAIIQGRQLDDTLDRLRRKGDDTTSSFDRLKGSLFSLKGLFATLGVAAFTKELLETADTLTQVRGRLGLVLDSTEQLARAEKELFKVAQQTRTGYVDTVNLYTKLAQATKSFITNQGDVLAITKLVNQSFQISGASAAEAAAGITQFGQALTSGVLQGDELRAIREQAPRLFTAILEGLQKTSPELKITRANFRDLASEGEITSERIAKALTSQAATIQAEYAKLPVTIGQRFTQIKNEVLRSLGSVDFSPITDALGRIGSTLADPALQSGIVSLVGGVVDIITNMVKLVGVLIEYQDALGAAAVATATFYAATKALLIFETIAGSIGTVLAGARIYAAMMGTAATATGVLTTALTGLRIAMATISWPVALISAAAGALFYFTRENDTADKSIKSTSKSLQELAEDKQWAASGKQIISDEDKQALKDGQEEINKLAQAMSLLASIRETAAAAGDTEGLKQIDAQSASAAAKIRELADAMRVLTGEGLKEESAAKAVSKGIEQANKAATERIAVLTRTNELIRSGMDASQAAKQAKMEADKVDTSLIKKAHELEAANEALTKSQEKSVEVAKKLSDTRKEASKQIDELKSGNQALRDGLNLEEAQLKAQLESKKFTTDQINLIIKETAVRKELQATYNATKRLEDLAEENRLMLAGNTALEARAQVLDKTNKLDAGKGKEVRDAELYNQALAEAATSLDAARVAEEAYQRQLRATAELAATRPNTIKDTIEQLEKQNAALRAGTTLEAQRAEAMLRAAGASDEQIKRIKDLTAEGKYLEQTLGSTAETLATIYRTAASNIYNAFRNTFRSILDDGIKSMKDLGRSLLSIFKDIIAEMATMALKPIIVQIVGQVSGIGGPGGLDFGTLADLGGKAANWLGIGAGAGGLASGGSISAGAASFGSTAGLNATSAFGGSAVAGGGLNATSAFGGTAASPGIGAGLGAAAGYGAIGYAAGSMLAGHGPFGKSTGNYVGAGAAAGAYIGTAVFPGIGTGVGAAAGAVVGALAAGIKGAWKTKSKDVAINFTDGLFDATVIEVRKKTNIVGSSKKKTSTDEVSDFDKQLNKAFEAMQKIGENIGLSFEGVAVSIKESIKGLKGAELDKKIAEIFTMATDSIAEQVLPALEEYQEGNESLTDTFLRVVGQASAVKDIFKSMGFTIDKSGIELVQFSQNLIDLIGTFEQASAALQGYAALTRTSVELQGYAQQQLDALSASLGIATIRSAADLRAIVDPLLLLGDAATDAEKAIIAALPQLVALTSQAYASAQQVADQAASNAAAKALQDERDAQEAIQRQKELAQAHEEARQKALEYRDSIIDVRNELGRTLAGLRGGSVAAFDRTAIINKINATTTAEGALALIGPLKDALEAEFDAAVDAVNVSRDAQIAAIEATRDASITALEDQRDVIKDQVALTKRLKEQAVNLRDYLRELNTDNRFQSSASTLTSAQANFERLVALANGGDEDALGQLRASASTLLDIGNDTLSSYEELQKLRAQVTTTFEQLAGSLEALPSQESLLESIDDQIEALTAAAEAQIAAVNAAKDAQIEVLKTGFANQVTVLLNAVTKLEAAGNAASASSVNAITSSLTSNITPLTAQATQANTNLNTGLIAPSTGVRGSLSTTNSTLGNIKVDTAEMRFLKKLDALVLLQFQIAYGIGYMLVKQSNPSADISSAVTSLFTFANNVLSSGRLNVLEPPSALPSALGNVFVNGQHAKQFALGGAFTNQVVSNPTFFNIGEMGEKGPEAIMPLTRHADGSLGVRAQLSPYGRNQDNSELVIELRQLRAEIREARVYNSAENNAQLSKLMVISKVLDGADDGDALRVRVEDE